MIYNNISENFWQEANDLSFRKTKVGGKRGFQKEQKVRKKAKKRRIK